MGTEPDGWKMVRQETLMSWKDEVNTNSTQPQAREITDAEIDALLSDEVGFARSVARVRVYRVVRAAIALANKKENSNGN